MKQSPKPQFEYLIFLVSGVAYWPGAFLGLRFLADLPSLGLDPFPVGT